MHRRDLNRRERDVIQFAHEVSVQHMCHGQHADDPRHETPAYAHVHQ